MYACMYINNIFIVYDKGLDWVVYLKSVENIIDRPEPSANEPAKDRILVHSTTKTNYKSTNFRKMRSSGISDVAFASVNS